MNNLYIQIINGLLHSKIDCQNTTQNRNSKQSHLISVVIDIMYTQYNLQRQVDSRIYQSKGYSFEYNTEQVTPRFSVTNNLTRNFS